MIYLMAKMAGVGLDGLVIKLLEKPTKLMLAMS